jgi:putative tricarboxylic transport membrane protein
VITAPPGLTDAERERITRWVTRVLRTPTWKEQLKRHDWQPFVKTGAELDRFVAGEQRRVNEVVADLGIAK